MKAKNEKAKNKTRKQRKIVFYNLRQKKKMKTRTLKNYDRIREPE